MKGMRQMRIFQTIWGYIVLISICKLFATLINFALHINNSYLFFFFSILMVAVLKISPLKNSNYPFAFLVQSRFQHSH